MIRPIINQETLDKLWEVYTPPPPSPPPEYRVYYDKENQIVCFSMERLEMSYVVVSKEIFETYRPDLFRIVDGQIVRRDLHFQNKLQLKANGTKFASIKGDQQFAVSTEWSGEKTFWDINDGNN
jgi:hypothetical protein